MPAQLLCELFFGAVEGGGGLKMLYDVSRYGCIYRRMPAPWKVINIEFLKGEDKGSQKEMYKYFQRGGEGASRRWVQSSISNNLERCKWEKCYYNFDSSFQGFEPSPVPAPDFFR